MIQKITQKALITNSEGKILAIRRTETAPSHPLCWDMPGGACEFGEDPKTAMTREVKEEAGISCPSLVLFHVVSHINGETQWITLGWAGAINDQDVSLSYEHDEFRWVTVQEFLELQSWETIYELIKKKFMVNANV
ncbi:NUDIX hydrolase [Candidatus Uhrbacteria bacterium]|nr:NUDIX hydrolase [Candidatus Uhrbacteria bacterium]